jgi:hypothetical protein
LKKTNTYGTKYGTATAEQRPFFKDFGCCKTYIKVFLEIIDTVVVKQKDCSTENRSVTVALYGI